MWVGSFCSSPLTGGLVLGRVVEEDRGVAGPDVGVGRVFLDPVEHVGAVVVELLELESLRPLAPGETEGVAAVPQFGIHSRSCLGSNDDWAPLTTAAVNRVDSRATGSLPSARPCRRGRRARARSRPGRAAGRPDPVPVDIPFPRFGPADLHGPGRVPERRLHRRPDPGRLGLRDEAVVNRRDRDPGVEQLPEVDRADADLVAVDPPAAVDVDDQRRGPLSVSALKKSSTWCSWSP